MKDPFPMKAIHDISLEELYSICSTRLEQIFTDYVHKTPSLELKTAMNYSLKNGGKRLRPLLIYATGLTFNGLLKNLDVPASAVELIHTYSLIHDDLPCMDNADLRRGKPSCHKEFGEGIAVLTGDALHTLAMQIIANHKAPLHAHKRLHMMSILTEACGPLGMASGQAQDIIALQDATISSDLLLSIYQLKTGALIKASILLGYLCANGDDEFHESALAHFGECIGLAFQIQDDIIDIEVASSQSGKIQGMDAKNNKLTYPKIFGLLEAKQKVNELFEESLEAINYLGDSAQLLRDLTKTILNRQQ